MSKEKYLNLAKKSNWLRKKVLEMAVNSGAGHIAPAFSCIEILVSLYYGGVLKIDPKDPNWSERDRFILSKGHAAIALYAILADLGFFSLSDLDNFTQRGSNLGSHVENSAIGVEATTGSLGHGLSLGTGIALGSRMDNKNYSTLVLMGDGECHEGSVWEAAMFASEHRLNNLTVIVDHNGLSATDVLSKYLDLNSLKDKWEAFGWDVLTVDGHSLIDLDNVFSKIKQRSSGKPLAVMAMTTKGKGVSFMESNPIWHYRIPIGEELEIAYKELDMSNEKR